MAHDAEDPTRDGLECGRGERFDDVPVFVGHPGRGGLEHMVDAGELFYHGPRVSPAGQRFLDFILILIRQDLNVLSAVEGQYGTLDPGQIGPRIELQEASEPGCEEAPIGFIR